MPLSSRSPTRLLRVQQEVVEQALRERAIQVALVEVVQAQVRAVREAPPLLAEEPRTHARFQGTDRPPDKRGDELLCLRADVREADLAGAPLDVPRIERVQIDGE